MCIQLLLDVRLSTHKELVHQITQRQILTWTIYSVIYQSYKAEGDDGGGDGGADDELEDELIEMEIAMENL